MILLMADRHGPYLKRDKARREAMIAEMDGRIDALCSRVVRFVMLEEL
jgi:hypothetical protein